MIDIEEEHKIISVNECGKKTKKLTSGNANRYGRQIIQHKDNWYP